MARIVLFGPAREAAGAREATIPGRTVALVLEAASGTYGDDLARLLPACRIWVNGSPADLSTVVGDEDEVAVLPPVSGG